MDWGYLCNKITLIWGSFISVILYLTGDDKKGLYVLLVLVLADYITGLAKAIICKCLNSQACIKGIMKKAMYLVAIIVANHLDIFFNFDNGFFRSLMIGMLVVNEAISCIENLEKAGVPFPQKIKAILGECKKK